MKDRSTILIVDDEPEEREALLAVFLSSGWDEHSAGPDPDGPPSDCLVISLPRGAPVEEFADCRAHALALRSRLTIILADSEDALNLKTLADLDPDLLLAKPLAPEIVCRLAELRLGGARRQGPAIRPPNRREESVNSPREKGTQGPNPGPGRSRSTHRAQRRFNRGASRRSRYHQRDSR